jgi:hypothetical protein
MACAIYFSLSIIALHLDLSNTFLGGKVMSNARVVSLAALLMLCLLSVGHTATIRVPADQPTIQAGVDASTNGDTVQVADGTYTGLGNRDIDFKGKKIRVVSENGADYTTIDCQAALLDPHRGFIFHTQEDSLSVLDGFTIRNGIALTATYYDHPIHGTVVAALGGGILCQDTSSPLIANCVIVDNEAWMADSTLQSGGGIQAIFYSAPRIVNCSLSNNSSQWGGAIDVDAYSSMTLIDCKIVSNTASHPVQAAGGAIAVWDGSSIIMIDCAVRANTASSTEKEPQGGGLVVYRSDSAVLTGCTFVSNEVTSETSNAYGGGLLLHESSLRLVNCSLSNNYSTFGAGALLGSRSSLSVDSCYFSENTADGPAGCIYFGDSVATLTVNNSIFVDNNANRGATIATNGADSVLVTGCTISGNHADSLGSGLYFFKNYIRPRVDRCILSYNTGSEVLPPGRPQRRLETAWIQALARL